MHINQSIKAGRYNLLAPTVRRKPRIEYSLLQFQCPSTTQFQYLGREDAAPLDYPRLQSEGFRPTHISESCDGLFLIFCSIMPQLNVLGFMQYTHILYLWNPSTKEHKILPTDISQLPPSPEMYHCAFGLGYDSIKNDYKVIRIMQHCVTSKDGPIILACNDHKCKPECNIETLVHLYCLRENSCRRIQGIPDFITDYLHYDLSSTGVFVKGSIHWWLQAKDFYRMLAFDVSREEYKEVPMPDNLKIDEFTDFSFGASENNLCMYQHFRDHHMDLFMMKEYGVKESWTKLFSVNMFNEILNPAISPLWDSNTEKQWSFITQGTKGYIMIDLEDVVRTDLWIESLVSLNQYSNVTKE